MYFLHDHVDYYFGNFISYLSQFPHFRLGRFLLEWLASFRQLGLFNLILLAEEKARRLVSKAFYDNFTPAPMFV